MIEITKDTAGAAKMEEGMSTFLGYQIMKKRLEVFKAKYSPKMDVSPLVQIFCSGVLSKSPAEVVMWAFTLNEIWAREGQPVTMAALADNFPMGFPTADEKHRLWDAQKVVGEREPGTSDNQVDDFRNWAMPEEKADGDVPAGVPATGGEKVS
jgi:hypothetical protein